MIKVEVDEAYAFDMLSILEVKLNYVNSDINYNNYNKLYSELKKALGPTKCIDIYTSQEYDGLYNANRKVYEYVEELNTSSQSKITGLEVHLANMERYKYKRELQAKYFNQELSEQKTKF